MKKLAVLMSILLLTCPVMASATSTSNNTETLGYFTFDYPADYTSEKDENSITLFASDSLTNEMINHVTIIGIEDVEGSAYITPFEKDIFLTSVYNEISDGTPATKPELKTINDISALSFSTYFSDHDMFCDITLYYFFGKLLSISYMYNINSNGSNLESKVEAFAIANSVKLTEDAKKLTGQ